MYKPYIMMTTLNNPYFDPFWGLSVLILAHPRMPKAQDLDGPNCQGV